MTSMSVPFLGASAAGDEETHFGYLFGAVYSEYNPKWIPASLKTVTVSGSCEISNYAFVDCTSIENIIISSNVTGICANAFSGCTSLKSIKFEDTSTWYRTTNGSNYINKSGGTSTSVTNTSTNVTYFTNTYKTYYWYKK